MTALVTETEARRVIVETPYAGEDQTVVERNLRYLRCCLHDCIRRGEAPFASHGLYTQPGVLEDRNEEERLKGIHAGFAWKSVAQATVVYTDLGITKGMKYGIDAAEKLGQPVEFRDLGAGWDLVTGDLATELWGR